MNKKAKQLAVKSLLSDRFATGNLIVVDKIELAELKTKGAIEILKALNIESKKTIIITAEENHNLVVATGNIPTVYVQTKAHLSVYDLIRGDVYVILTDAVKQYEEDLK
jgi:large subunit ribosomal protein L4